MDPIAAYHHMIDAILATTGMTDKEAHFNAGLAIYVGVQYLRRTRRASLDALMTVIACEGLNELLDFLFFGQPRWGDTLGDIAATLAWPVILFAVSRHRRRRWARDGQTARTGRKASGRQTAPAPV